MYNSEFMELAISWAKKGKLVEGGGSFGCVIVRENEIIAQCHNEVSGSQDCTQHAELKCIQMACKALNSKTLEDCVLYTSCVPCMMCLGAMKWAKFKHIYYGASAQDAKEAGFLYSDMYYSYDATKRDKDFNMTQKMQAEAVAVWT